MLCIRAGARIHLQPKLRSRRRSLRSDDRARRWPQLVYLRTRRSPPGQPPQDEVIVTGTRIRSTRHGSSSPIYSISDEDIHRQQEPEIEKLLRLLPITAPAITKTSTTARMAHRRSTFAASARNATWCMVNGKRMVPFNFDGEVDTSMIPTALVERIDIVTGGASAVYGSDAISGALNVITKNDFEGVDIQWNTSQTGEGDGEDTFVAVTLGTNAADGAANIVLSLGYQEREPILLGARPLGQLGIARRRRQLRRNSSPANRRRRRRELHGARRRSRRAAPGRPCQRAFRSRAVPRRPIPRDGTLAANCNKFNFNPYNYYQTPLKRYNATVIGEPRFGEDAEVYSMFNYGKARWHRSVAPSGIFGTNYFTPLSNPLIGAQARQFLIDRANAGRTPPGTVNFAGIPNLSTPNPNDTLFHNWND